MYTNSIVDTAQQASSATGLSVCVLIALVIVGAIIVFRITRKLIHTCIFALAFAFVAMMLKRYSL